MALSDLEDLASPISAFVRDRCALDGPYSIECNKLFDAWLVSLRCGPCSGGDNAGRPERPASSASPGVRRLIIIRSKLR